MPVQGQFIIFSFLCQENSSAEILNEAQNSRKLKCIKQGVTTKIKQ